LVFINVRHLILALPFDCSASSPIRLPATWNSQKVHLLILLEERSAAPKNRDFQMSKRFYRVTRDLHLYFGLFISPFVLIFAGSVFFLVHTRSPQSPSISAAPAVTDLTLPADLEELSGRQRVDKLKPVLDRLGVQGEVGWIQYFPKQHRLVIPVTIPGRVTTVTLDVTKREASIERRTTGLAEAVVVLHMSPGQHLADIRKNWIYMRIWSWLADATVYLVLFLTASGLYLWYVLRTERRIGIGLLVAGALSFFGLVYALWR
jgi:hypothetical protein